LRTHKNPEQELAQLKNIVQEVAECLFADFAFDTDKKVNGDGRHRVPQPVVSGSPSLKRPRPQDDPRVGSKFESRLHSRLNALEKSFVKQFTELRALLPIDASLRSEQARTQELLSLVRVEAESRSELVAKALNLLIVDHFEREQRLQPVLAESAASVVGAANYTP